MLPVIRLGEISTYHPRKTVALIAQHVHQLLISVVERRPVHLRL
jgi:hypothetical protein